MSSDRTIGEYLKQVREQQGYSLQDISDAINVRTGQLKAIEEGRVEELPGKIYAVGFVKSYASLLDLDPDAAANQFKMEHYAQPMPVETEAEIRKKKKQQLISEDGEHDNRVPTIPVILAAVVFLVLCFAAWTFLKPDRGGVHQSLKVIPDAPEVELASEDIQIPVSTDPVAVIEGNEDSAVMASNNVENEATQTAEAEKAVPALETPSQTPTTAASNQTETQSAAVGANTSQQQPLGLNETAQLNRRANQVRVALRANADSWIKVTDSSGRSLFQKVLRPGDEYLVPDQKGLEMATGNAGGLDIYVDGKKVLPIGGSGDILRGVSLNPEELKSRRVYKRRR